jgi:hypothetical protein
VNATDPWSQNPSQTIVRPDFAGLPLQVGLCQAMFTANLGLVVFDTFTLVADGLGGAQPPSATNLTISASLNGALVLNWTPGQGSTGSVAVVRSGSPINAQPENGITYTANPGFGLGSEIGDGNYVVYAGDGSSVTVTNLPAGVTYYAAVYSFAGSNASPAYALETGAATNAFLGVLQSVSLAVPQNRIPAGGIGKSAVTGVFSGVSKDVTAAATLVSSDTNVLAVSGGILTGLTNGSAIVSAVYGGMTNSQMVKVTAPSFTDNFSANHNYLTGVGGTSWDGVYATPGGLPGTTYASDPAASISGADANITSNGVLTVTTLNVGWEYAQNDGFFLFKNVTGDFQVAAQILNTLTNPVVPYNNPGLLARAYGPGGVPFVGGTNESWVSWTRFDEFGIGTYARETLNNATTRDSQPTADDGYYWLLMVRENGTNFSFYQRQSPADPWQTAPDGTTYSIAAFAGQPLQVGILACAFDSGTAATSQLSDFMLDTGLAKLTVGRSGADVVLAWPEGAGTLQVTPSLSPANWQDVTVSPVLTGGTNTVTLPATNTASFFRLVQ